MPDAAQLAQAHWNETPLFLTEQERYSTSVSYTHLDVYKRQAPACGTAHQRGAAYRQRRSRWSFSFRRNRLEYQRGAFFRVRYGKGENIFGRI